VSDEFTVCCYINQLTFREAAILQNEGKEELKCRLLFIVLVTDHLIIIYFLPFKARIMKNEIGFHNDYTITVPVFMH
jgi:hypothetical protein